MKPFASLTTIAVVLLCVSAGPPSGNEISRSPDGPFAFDISGIKINDGSTMQRETILFNDPSCPAQLDSHTTSINYKDRGFRFVGRTQLTISHALTAIEVRTIQFDVFGKHMQNLSKTEPRDLAPGTHTLTGEWRARENDVAEMLTTVSYVARARLSDGTQWIYDSDNLSLALPSLQLEKKIGEGESE